MKYSFHPEARVEFKEATLYYSEKSHSLGSAFYSEVEYAIKRIVDKNNGVRSSFLTVFQHNVKNEGLTLGCSSGSEAQRSQQHDDDKIS